MAVLFIEPMLVYGRTYNRTYIIMLSLLILTPQIVVIMVQRGFMLSGMAVMY
jgi:uncharacterized membrane protein YkgB